MKTKKICFVVLETVRVTKCNRILCNRNYWRGKVREKERNGRRERMHRSKNKAAHDIGERTNGKFKKKKKKKKKENRKMEKREKKKLTKRGKNVMHGAMK